MMRYVVIATLRRGVLDPPELLDEPNSWRAWEGTAEEEGRRRTLNWGRERDAQLSDEEAAWLRRRPRAECRARQEDGRIERMLRLAARRRA